VKNGEEVLRACERKHGELTPSNLLADASSSRHPWHARFTWDNDAAAHAHRLDQARTFIRQVRFTVVTETAVYRSVAFVRNPERDSWQQGYLSVTKLRTDKEMAADALLAEFGRVASLLKRARDIGMALGLEKDIDQIVIDIEGLSGRVRQRRRPSGSGPRVAA
jgi:hypothetical protein